MRKALGRGLSSLISTPVVPVQPGDSKIISINNEFTAQQISSEQASTEVSTGNVAYKNEPRRALPGDIQYVDVAILTNNPKQPRQVFNDTELADLSRSIKEQGLIQPIVVRPIKNTISSFQYEIVAGERRWRAATQAGITQVPVIIKDLDDRQTLELAIIENVQRENLNPVELAQAYDRLATEFNLSQEQVAERVGKERTSVTNLIRILKLHPEVLALVSKDILTLGHAKVLLGLRDQAGQLSLAKRAERDGLSVRALETLVSQVAVLDRGPRARRAQTKKEGEHELSPLESRLRYALGTKVAIEKHPSGSGKIEIRFATVEEFDRLLEKLAPV